MTDAELDKIAELIARDLFTCGTGRVADRLILVNESSSHNSRIELSGWGMTPMRDRIIKTLKAELGGKDKP